MYKQLIQFQNLKLLQFWITLPHELKVSWHKKGCSYKHLFHIMQISAEIQSDLKLVSLHWKGIINVQT